MIPIPQFDKSLGFAIKKDDYEALLRVVRADQAYIEGVWKNMDDWELRHLRKEYDEAREALPEHLRTVDKK